MMVSSGLLSRHLFLVLLFNFATRWSVLSRHQVGEPSVFPETSISMTLSGSCRGIGVGLVDSLHEDAVMLAIEAGEESNDLLRFTPIVGNACTRFIVQWELNWTRWCINETLNGQKLRVWCRRVNVE